MDDNPVNEFVLTFLGSATRLNDRWVRPHDLVVHPAAEGKPSAFAVEGTVARVTHLGFEVKVDVDLANDETCWVQLSRGSVAQSSERCAPEPRWGLIRVVRSLWRGDPRACATGPLDRRPDRGPPAAPRRAICHGSYCSVRSQSGNH